MRSALVLSLVALAAAGCGDPLFFAEVKEERVCVTRVGTSIPGAPVGEQSVRWEGEIELDEDVRELEEKGASGTIEILSVSIDGGQTDLSGITRTALRITDDAGAVTTVIDYDPPQPVPVPTHRIVARGGEALNVFSYLSSGVLRFSVELAGAPPESDWDADVEVCLSATVMIDAIEAANGSN